MAKGGSSFREILTVLLRHEVEFVVCGGVACVLHGVTRVTNDVDISVRMTDENLTRLVSAAREMRLRPRFPEPIEAILDAERRQSWVEEKRAKFMTLVSDDGLRQIDVFLQYPVSYESLAADAEFRPLGGHELAISSRQHLLVAKRNIEEPRPNDRYDIEALERIEREHG